METTRPTPREVRHTLNRMERWFAKNRHRFTLQRQEAADRLLDLAETAEHADALGEALKAWAAEGDRIARLVEGVGTAAGVEPAAKKDCLADEARP